MSTNHIINICKEPDLKLLVRLQIMFSFWDLCPENAILGALSPGGHKTLCPGLCWELASPEPPDHLYALQHLECDPSHYNGHPRAKVGVKLTYDWPQKQQETQLSSTNRAPHFLKYNGIADLLKTRSSLKLYHSIDWVWEWFPVSVL